jgi:aspartate/methionine/tyrosine aminotransferase
VENSILNKQYKFDFGFGDTRGIREIMMSHIPGKFLETDFGSYGYPPHVGNPELIEEVRDLIVDLTGKQYKHVLITNGATNALNAYIYAAKNGITRTLITHPLYFMMYPGIAKLHGLEHKTSWSVNPSYYGGELGFVDSPNNPTGKLFTGPICATGTVWDSSYHTPTYCGVRSNPGSKLKCIGVTPCHEAMAGSLSKLTGINGLRVGWLATDNDAIFQKAYHYVEHDLCGVSNPSQHAALQILKKVNLQEFYEDSKVLLDTNRDTLSRLNHIFSGQAIFPVGMYALFEVDSKLRDLLERASVHTLDGRLIGDHRDSVRFNLANSAKSTKAMVNAILKEDKR